MKIAKILKAIRKNTKSIKNQNQNIKSTSRSQRRNRKNKKKKNPNIKRAIINLMMRIQISKKKLNPVNWSLFRRRKNPSDPRVKVLPGIID